MSQNTGNSTAFIEAEQYSAFILRNLHDGLLPGQFYRNVSDFGNGTTLNIKTLGDVVIQEGSEEVPFDYTAIESGTVPLTITEYPGDSWYVTDDMREDGSQVDALMAERQAESVRKFQEFFESKFLARCNTAQTDGNDNTVNSFAHRVASTETNDIFALSHLIDMKLAFDKAEVPYAGRVCILDPVAASVLDRLSTVTHDVTPFGQKILENGFDRDHQFLMNLYGWNIITSNRLAKGSFSDGSNTISTGVANVFMSILDDNTKPIMAAWRRMPRVEGERNKDLRRDEFTQSARFGIAPQRIDTLGILITDATNVA